MPYIKKERLNPLEVLNNLEITENIDHITFDKNVVENYRIVRQQNQIGIPFFTDEFVKKALSGIVTSKSRPLTFQPNMINFKPIYTLGEIKLITLSGRIHLYGGIQFGQKQRLIIPVKITYVPIT